MSEQTWVSPLQFKIVGNFLEIMNKENTFRFNDMVEGNPRNSYLFVPVSRCSDIWYNNIKSDYTLNYDVVTPLQYKVEGEEAEPLTLDGVRLLAEDTESKGIVVSVLEQTPTILLGDVVQEFKGCFIINEVTGAVIAYCILPETVDISEYIIFSYQGYLLEINNDVKVLDLELPTLEEEGDDEEEEVPQTSNIIAEYSPLQEYTSTSTNDVYTELEPSFSSTVPFHLSAQVKTTGAGYYFGIRTSGQHTKYIAYGKNTAYCKVYSSMGATEKGMNIISNNEWHTYDIIATETEVSVYMDNSLIIRKNINFCTGETLVPLRDTWERNITVSVKDIVVEKLEVENE